MMPKGRRVGEHRGANLCPGFRGCSPFNVVRPVLGRHLDGRSVVLKGKQRDSTANLWRPHFETNPHVIRYGQSTPLLELGSQGASFSGQQVEDNYGQNPQREVDDSYCSPEASPTKPLFDQHTFGEFPLSGLASCKRCLGDVGALEQFTVPTQLYASLLVFPESAAKTRVLAQL